MSNWNGVGTPENGQNLSAGDRKIVKFVGVNSWGHWVIEDENGNPKTYNPFHCSPVKTPEQVERENTVDHAMDLLGLREADNVSTVKQCLAILYDKGLLHNQPKVKPISLTEFKTTVSSGDGYSIAFTALVSCGHIIEAKECDNE